ncbi:hypothetical protein C8R43DRAFT_1118502 [Mycena crocata]|nr:hypothetical protein C8R43DRAFT_1118502 [Mycena crocata]
MASHLLDSLVEVFSGAREPRSDPFRPSAQALATPGFVYSNAVWRRKGPWPAPTDHGGVQCECRTTCMPMTCLCASDKPLGTVGRPSDKPSFSYHLNLALRKSQRHLIHECSQRCSCGETCPNRVVQQGRKVEVDVRVTESRGTAVFAAQDIPRGSYLGFFAGELLTENQAALCKFVCPTFKCSRP